MSMMKVATDWLYKQSRIVTHGEITVTLKMHDGEIRQVEEHIKMIEKPEPAKAGDRDDFSR